MSSTQTCNNCKQIKDISCFGKYFDKRCNKQRIRKECGSCRTEREQARSEANRERTNGYKKKYKENHKEKVKEMEKNRLQKKRQEDENYGKKCYISQSTREYIYRKKCKCFEPLIGCSHDQIQTWFSYLKPNEEWEIDHVIPLAFFDLSNEKQIALAAHWTNIRPLSPNMNIEKADKIVKETILDHAKNIQAFLEKHSDFQTSEETRWWQRFKLWYGKNEQDEENFESFLKWKIRSEDPK